MNGTRLRAELAGVDHLVAQGGYAMGFEVLTLSGYAPDDADPEVWEGPQFAVPALGLGRGLGRRNE